MIILQALFMKLIGPNELAVRLPSAFAALLTVASIMFLSEYYFKSFWYGFITAIILITSQGYIGIHATRTGDYDALLTLFTTLYGISFFLFIENNKNKYLYLFFLFSSLAVLTKSVVGVLFFPALFTYAFINGKIIFLLKNKHSYLGLSIFIILVFGYYTVREIALEGYIKAVMVNELGGRFLKVVENHSHGFWYYYNNIIHSRLNQLWVILIPIGTVLGFASKSKKIKNFTLFSVIMVVEFFLIISVAKTKLEWYDIPLYPYLAFIIANSLFLVFTFLNNYKKRKKYFIYKLASFIFLFILMLGPYTQIIKKTHKPVEYYWDKELYEMSYYLRNAVNDKDKSLNNALLIRNGYTRQLELYINVLHQENINVQIIKSTENLKKGMHIIASEDQVKQKIEKNYHYRVIKEQHNIKIYEIL